MGTVEPRYVLPGMRICAEEDYYQSGPGTYPLQGYIYSSLAGTLNLKPVDVAVETGNAVNTTTSSTKSTSSSSGGKREVLVVEVSAPGEQNVLPSIGDIVTAKVLSVNPRLVYSLYAR